MASVTTDRRQGVNSSLAIKVPVKAATTANITLSGEQTIDGVSCTSGDRVLVKDQTTGSENGIYDVATSSWSRSPDFDGAYDVTTGTLVKVMAGGTTNGGYFYELTTTGTITIGTTSLAFSGSTIVPGISSSANATAIIIDSSENVGIGVTPTNPFHVVGSSAGAAICNFNNSSATDPNGVYVNLSGASTDNNTQYFLYCDDSTTARLIIYSDGDVINHDNSYGAISDVKLKQDIIDASSQWDDIKALQVRKYRMITDVEADANAPYMLGVIAQEAELVSPGLIRTSPDRDAEGNDLGTETKSVMYSVLYMKAVKALQEAMDRIEQLEQRVNALETN